MDGDGFLDILDGNTFDGVSAYDYVSHDRSDQHRLLEEVVNSFGGRITLAYSRYPSANNDPIYSGGRWVVNLLQTNDGLGQSTEKRYEYLFGKYAYWPWSEFRGFGYVKAIDPAGHYMETLFHQDDWKKGRINTVYARDSAGLKFTSTTYGYLTSNPFPGVFRVDDTGGSVTTFDKAEDGKIATTQFGDFDDYGQARLKIISGSNIKFQTTYTTFLYNTDAYIVNRPSKIQVTNDTGITIGQTWFAYDGRSENDIPTKGDLTKERHWLSGGGDADDPVIQYAYDGYGNRIGTIDAKKNECATTGYTTRIHYDDIFHAFPVLEINALCQEVAKSYWRINAPSGLDANSVPDAFAVPGFLATVTDPNGHRIDSYWDALGRPKASVVPPDTATAPTLLWGYEDYEDTTSTTPDITTPSYTVESKREAVGGGTLDQFTYLDGFGRPIQTKSEAEAPGEWVTRDTWYNNRGLVESVSIPYFTNAGTYSPRADQPKTTTLYDAVRRIIRIDNPDGTFRTTEYDRWVVTEKDEKGISIVRTYDALGRLIKVLEPDMGETRLTAYSYEIFDSSGNRTERIYDAQQNDTFIDYDTLGRKKELRDNDLGNWSYSYDANGNLAVQTDARGKKTFFVYDALNRIKRKLVADAPDSAPPTAPSNLRATAVSADQISLAWNVSTDDLAVQEYELERCQGSSCTIFSRIDKTTGITYTDTNLLEDTSYSYRVRAVDFMGKTSSYSSVLSKRTAPLPPQSLTAVTLNDDGQIKLTWTPSTSTTAIGQRIYRATSAGGPYTLFANIGKLINSHTVAGLVDGTIHYFVVRAFNGDGAESLDSNEASSVAVDNVPPQIWDVGTSLASSGNTITVTISTLNEPAYVQVEYGTTPAYGSMIPFTTTLSMTNSIVLSNLSPSTIYYYRVRAQDASGHISTSIGFSVSTAEWVTNYIAFSGGVEIFGGVYDAHKSIVDSAGNIYVTGYTPAPGGSAGFTQYATLKYDTNGNLKWLKGYDSGGYDYAVDLAADSLGNLYVTGSGGYNYVTVKYDSGGNEVWVRPHGNSDTFGVAVDIEVDSSGNIYITGYGAQAGTSNIDYVTLKYDSSGNLLWEKRYDAGHDDFAQALALDTQGNIYVTGYTCKDSPCIDRDYATIKYDPNGNLLWNRIYDVSDDYATSIKIDKSENVYVTGAVYGDNYGYHTLKYGQDGALLWAVRYAQGVAVRPTSNNSEYQNLNLPGAPLLALDNRGNIYISGTTFSSSSIDYTTIKYDSSGNQIWEKLYQTGGNNEAYALLVDRSENIYVSGKSNRCNSALNNVPYCIYSDFATVKYDANGNELWVRRHDKTSFSYGDDEAVSIGIDNSGNVYVTGNHPGSNTLKYLVLPFPTGLSAVDKASDQGGEIELTWTPSSDTRVTQQRVYRSVSSGGPYNLIVALGRTAQSYVDTNLTNGTTYYYVIRSSDGIDESFNSAETSAVPLDSTPTIPSGLIATAISTAQIRLSWTASTDDLGVDHYEVIRSSNNGSYTLIASPTTVEFIDNIVTPDTTYLYRVRAVDADGNVSAYSNIDLATTVIFIDDPIVSSSENPSTPTVVKAEHFTQLLTAVNAVRAAAGLAAFTWSTTDGLGNPILPPAQGNLVRAQHILDLRTNLNQGLSALGFSPPSYTDPTLTTGAGGTLIKKDHIQQLRQGVK
jgi:YD repeat-containing protein